MKSDMERRGTLWLAVCLLPVCTVPFLSIWRTGPLASFYLESGSLLFALLLVAVTAWTGRMNVPPSRTSVYFLVLALFWWLQARVMDLPYWGQSDQAVWTFAVLALAAWAVRGWVRGIGQDAVAAALAWALLAGGLLQSVVAWMQFSGAAEQFAGYLAFYGRSEVSGQLGQRNHLGHYLMWSALSAAYLWSQRRLSGLSGAAAVLFLAATLGLVGSRTILLYVAVTALLLLCWRWQSGRSGNRVLVLWMLLLVSVVLVQLSLNGIVSLFGGAPVETALQRAGASSFAGSARDVEWKNAWQVFLGAPWWGHGWGSFAWQGFWQSRFEQGFSPNGISVLFTHSHNLILQLLAEMGLIGTLGIAGGALWAVWPLFRRPVGASALLLLALMSVSLCHSMLEYPLWYIYFLVPFGLMMACTPDSGRSAAAWAVWPRWAVGVTAPAVAAGIVRLAFVYHDLVYFDQRNDADDVMTVSRKIEGLQRISATEPLLAYYADLSLTRRASPTDDQLAAWAVEATERSVRYRPYATAYQLPLYRFRLGHKQEAAEFLEKLYRYYPNTLPFYLNQTRQSPYFAELYPQALAVCEEYRRLKPQAKACTEP